MEEALSEWLANANEAVNINLVRAGKEAGTSETVFEEPFHPTFTYTVFGEEEAIFGYRNPQINLRFRAHDLQPSLEFKHDGVFEAIGETKPMDIPEILKDYLPQDALRTDNQSLADLTATDTGASSWTPPGSLQHSYTHNERRFEIWCSSLADPTVKEILRSMQILVPFYIEGGTCQNLDDQDWTLERWKIFLIYEVANPPPANPARSPYTIVGFSTSYRLWVFPSGRKTIDESFTHVSNGAASLPTPPPTLDPESIDPEAAPSFLSYNPLDSHSRERISQFLILPPYQHQSHGTHLYTAMTELFLADPHVFEVTVEDPNEAFDDMRDYCDLLRLRQDPSFAALTLADSVPPDSLDPEKDVPTELLLPESTLAALRQASKISPRQFSRLTEMQLLSKIPPRHRSRARITRKAKAADPNDRRYYFWRLVVKVRLTIKNRDQLAQLDVEERIEKLEETLAGVEEEYVRILDGAEKRAKFMDSVAKSREVANGRPRGGLKRKGRVIDEEDDDDDETVAGSFTQASVGAKRPKVADANADE